MPPTLARQNSLLRACVDGDLVAVKAEVQKDSNAVNTHNLAGDNEPVLLFCIKEGQWAIVDYLLSLSNTDILKCDGKGGSALHAAAKYGGPQALKVVQSLISLGAKVESEDKNEKTPLWVALCRNHVSIARYLLEKGKANHRGIDPENGSTALINCAGHGHVDSIELLLELKRIDSSDLEYCNLEDAGNVCALDIAFMTGNLACAELLIRQYEKLSFPFPKTALAGFLLGLDPTQKDIIDVVETMAKRLNASPGDPLNWGGVTVYAVQIVMTLEDTKPVQALGKWLFDTFGAPPDDEEDVEGIDHEDHDEEALRILDHLKISAVGAKQSWKSRQS